MATRRSLNKMERRAHMSIHNTAEVTDLAPEPQGNAGSTRDRFGKSHLVLKDETAC